jgi:hypothetical protein
MHQRRCFNIVDPHTFHSSGPVVERGTDTRKHPRMQFGTVGRVLSKNLAFNTARDHEYHGANCLTAGERTVESCPGGPAAITRRQKSGRERQKRPRPVGLRLRPRSKRFLRDFLLCDVTYTWTVSSPKISRFHPCLAGGSGPSRCANCCKVRW